MRSNGIDFGTIIHRLRVEQAPRNKHFEQLSSVANNPIYLSLIGGYGGPLCFEWKIQRSEVNQALIARLEGDLSGIQAAVASATGQTSQWQPRGKGSSDNVILALRYADRPDTEESEAAWASRTYPVFVGAIGRRVDTGRMSFVCVSANSIQCCLA